MTDADLLALARARFGAELPDTPGRVIPLTPHPSGQGYSTLDGPMVGQLGEYQWVYLRERDTEDEDGTQLYRDWAVSRLPSSVALNLPGGGFIVCTPAPRL